LIFSFTRTRQGKCRKSLDRSENGLAAIAFSADKTPSCAIFFKKMEVAIMNIFAGKDYFISGG